MVFRIQEDTITLILDDYSGAEVLCKANVSLGQMLSLRDLGSNEENLREAYETFASSVLISWNIEDDNGPVPATSDGLMQLPTGLASSILGAWGEQLTNPPPISSTA